MEDMHYKWNSAALESQRSSLALAQQLHIYEHRFASRMRAYVCPLCSFHDNFSSPFSPEMQWRHLHFHVHCYLKQGPCSQYWLHRLNSCIARPMQLPYPLRQYWECTYTMNLRTFTNTSQLQYWECPYMSWQVYTYSEVLGGLECKIATDEQQVHEW